MQTLKSEDLHFCTFKMEASLNLEPQGQQPPIEARPDLTIGKTCIDLIKCSIERWVQYTIYHIVANMRADLGAVRYSRLRSLCLNGHPSYSQLSSLNQKERTLLQMIIQLENLGKELLCCEDVGFGFLSLSIDLLDQYALMLGKYPEYEPNRKTFIDQRIALGIPNEPREVQIKAYNAGNSDNPLHFPLKDILVLTQYFLEKHCFSLLVPFIRRNEECHSNGDEYFWDNHTGRVDREFYPFQDQYVEQPDRLDPLQIAYLRYLEQFAQFYSDHSNIIQSGSENFSSRGLREIYDILLRVQIVLLHYSRFVESEAILKPHPQMFKYPEMVRDAVNGEIRYLTQDTTSILDSEDNMRHQYFFPVQMDITPFRSYALFDAPDYVLKPNGNMLDRDQRVQKYFSDLTLRGLAL